uniref:CKK domain-containing protein n=1 Tax=Steinernema glaseri TaxID=37863 RepID=A0A1I7ZBZ2_9BILA
MRSKCSLISLQQLTDSYLFALINNFPAQAVFVVFSEEHKTHIIHQFEEFVPTDEVAPRGACTIEDPI